MKKLAIISLLCIYALATMGFSLKEFYCCGKLKSISLTLADDGKAKCKNGDSNTDGCCKNKFQYFKVKDNHLASAHEATALNSFSELPTIVSSYHFISFPTQQVDVINGSHAPPLYTGVPIFISNCVFLIWFLLLWLHNILFCNCTCLILSTQILPIYFYCSLVIKSILFIR